MPRYEITAPNGRRFEVTAPEGASQEDVLAYAQSQFYAPSAPKAKPDTGFTGALKAGTEELKGELAALAGRIGLTDVEEAEKYREAQKKKAGEIFKPTEEGWTEAPVTKFKELLGGSLPYMAAPLVAGAAASTAPVSAPVAAALGLGAAGLTSAAQFTATNISRQVDEGSKLANTDLLAAGTAAIPQAALDTLSFRMMPGIRRIFGDAGIKLTQKEATELAQRGILSTAGDLSLQGAKVAGIEGTTEAAQQFFERMQAGLNLTDAEARKEYYENFIGGAVLGGAFGGAGRAFERAFPKIEREPAAPVTPPEGPAGIPETAKQAELFTKEEAPFAVTPDESVFAQRQAAMMEEGKQQEALVRLDSLRNEFDTLQRENERLLAQAGSAATDEERKAARAEAAKLTPALTQLETEITKVRRQLGAAEAARPAAAPGQMGLDFEAPVITRQRTPEGQVLGAAPAAPAGLTAAQQDFFAQQRIQDIQNRIQAGEMVTPAEQQMLRDAALGEQQRIAAAPTPDITVPEEKRAAPPPFELAPSGEPQYTRDAAGRVRRTTPYEDAVPTKPEPEVREVTEDDFKAMGIGPSNKKLREAIIGKDLTKPKQRATVRQALEEYAGAPNRSPKIAAAVENFLSTGPFMEQMGFDFKGVQDVRAEPAGGVEPGGVEPSVPVPSQPAARPARAKAPVSGGVGPAGKGVGLPDVRKRDEQPALDEATRRGLDKFADMLRKEPGAVDLGRRLVNLPADQQAYVRGQLAPAFKPRYRKAPKGIKGQTKAATEANVRDLMRDWENAPNTQVVQSITELPDYMQEEIRSAGVNPKGAFDPRTETVFIIADNIVGRTDLIITVAHEAIGHYGLRSVLGGTYSRVLNDLYKTNDQVRAKADIKIKEGLNKEIAIEEVLAEAIEEKVPPNTALGKAIQIIKKLLRRAFQAFGVKTLNDKEVQSLLDSFVGYVVEGKGVRAEGVAGPQAGVFKKAPTLTAAGQQAQAAVNAMAGISNEKPKTPQKSTIGKVGAFVFDPAYRQDVLDRFRVQVAYKGASVERKLMDQYNGAIRDALGNIRPDIFMTAAEHSDTLAVAAMKSGGIRLDKNIGWVAVEGKASISSVIDQIKVLGEKLGNTELAFKLANDAFIARRANALKNNPDVDVSSLPDQAKIDAGLQAFKDFPELEKAFNDFTDYKNGLIDGMVEGGRLSADRAKAWKDAADYVPWNRIKEYEDQIQNSPKMYFKGLVNLGDMGKIRGGTDEINNIFDNMVGLSFWMVNSAVRNHAALQLTDAFVKNNLGAKRVRPGQSGVDPNKTIYLYRDGTPEVYEFDSMADVYAFKGVESIGGPFIDAFTSLSNFLRKTTTAMPQFAFSQLFQDSYRAMVMSGVKSPFTVGAKVLGGFVSAHRGDETTRRLESMGIVGMYDLVSGRARDQIEKEFGIRQRSITDKTLEKLESFSIASDTALRKAVFEQTLAETKSAQFPDGDVLLARMRAQEVINFKRQGANRAVGVMRQIVPFMNAYIQGMDVFYRTMTGRGIAAEERAVAFKLFLKTGAKLATLSAIYTLLVGDDEEYQGLRDYERDKNFIFPGTGFKTPVAPEVGFLFKVLPERAINYITSQGTERPQDAQDLRKALATAAFDAFTGPNLTPQFVKPALEVLMNYSFFQDAPIVGRGIEKLEPSEQFTASTSELAKMIGGLANISPVKLEYMFRGYTGIAGGTMLDVSNMMFADRPERRAYEMPILKTFMYDQIPGGIKEEYYNYREKVDRVNSTVNALKAQGRADEIEEYLTDDRLQLLALKSSVNKIDSHLEKSRAYRKLILADKDMSSAEKRDLIDEIDRNDNEIIRAYNLPGLRSALRE